MRSRLRSQGLRSTADNLIALGPKVCSNGYAVRIHSLTNDRAEKELARRYPNVVASGYNNILLHGNSQFDFCLMFAS